ncbi:DUF2158 domain-containing protein [Methylobacterium terricola]|uniref:DUF2158 domain-containing protein n=1 Tax=Methylobacterium terricola TaxID=2583531 RepID=A0A5C4LE79_9HYPH|nr:DUF2158 domain-containing protein [Methylobacterium terricola]TNC10856.1 DUF2158 domain-containing protein [Methylobacterium terricola]
MNTETDIETVSLVDLHLEAIRAAVKKPSPPTFKAGDIVRLKTWSPNMTVTGLNKDRTVVFTKWYDTTLHTFCTESFEIETIVLAQVK